MSPLNINKNNYSCDRTPSFNYLPTPLKNSETKRRYNRTTLSEKQENDLLAFFEYNAIIESRLPGLEEIREQTKSYEVKGKPFWRPTSIWLKGFKGRHQAKFEELSHYLSDKQEMEMEMELVELGCDENGFGEVEPDNIGYGISDSGWKLRP